jgi:hypothetical protein
MEKTVKAALKDYARQVADLLKQPTDAWQASFQPEFIVTEPEMEGNDLVCYAGVKPASGQSNDENVYPADVYKWISRGTKSHKIAARKAPMLKFMSEYSPSTRQGSWSSSAPSYSGYLRVHRQVTHSGIEPRNYEEMAAEEMGPGLADYIQDRIGLLVKAQAVPLGSALQEAENISAARGVRRPWRK